MKIIFLNILLFFSFVSFSQNEQLALDYFEKGEFEKAVSLLEEISNKQPSNYYYFERTIDCYQQLQKFDKAENLIESRKIKFNQPVLFVELGYNFQLQKNTTKATKQFELALKEIEKQPNNAYQIGSAFNFIKGNGFSEVFFDGNDLIFKELNLIKFFVTSINSEHFSS